MKKVFLSIFLLSSLTSYSLISQSKQTGILEITFTGLRNEQGQVTIGMNHENPDGFPRQADIELQFKKDKMNDGKLTVQIPDLNYGSYAISVLDDENSNMDIDMFLGIPKEGFGFSTNPPFKLRAPRFEECAFEINQPLTKISIELRYAGKGR